MEKPKSLGEHCDEITARIDAALAEPILTPEELAKRDSVMDMEFLLQERVEAGQISREDAELALSDYLDWLDRPPEVQRLIDPSQETLF